MALAFFLAEAKFVTAMIALDLDGADKSIRHYGLLRGRKIQFFQMSPFRFRVATAVQEHKKHCIHPGQTLPNLQAREVFGFCLTAVLLR